MNNQDTRLAIQAVVRSSGDAAIAELQARQHEVQAQLVEIEGRYKLAETTATEIENARNCSQAYVVSAMIQQSGSINDVRELDLIVEVANACTVPVPPLELVIRVYEAVPVDTVKDTIDRTQQIARLESISSQIAQAGYLAG